MTIEAKKAASIHFKIDGVWHRVFELKEQGEKHIMAWEGCPLNLTKALLPEKISIGHPRFEGETNLCEPCYKEG